MTLEEDGPAAGQSPSRDKGKPPVKAQRYGHLRSPEQDWHSDITSSAPTWLGEVPQTPALDGEL